MSDVIEVSYTGDLLAHRRCRRAWAYEKRAGFYPYEVVQAMEGRLVHHAMEWLTRRYQDVGQHATERELAEQLEHYFRVLWARGIRTAFVKKADTIGRVVKNLYPDGRIDPIVRAVVEGAQHTEYELRAVRKVLPADLTAFSGKSRILLTGVLDLVIQQQEPLTYRRTWIWDSIKDLSGHIDEKQTHAAAGDVEIWDYKGTRARNPFVEDYVRQLLTYAALFRDRTGTLPRRCVLFFINESQSDKRLLAIDVHQRVVDRSLRWTYKQVREIRSTTDTFEADPTSVPAGELAKKDRPLGKRISRETAAQCTTCSQRFDCPEYAAYLPRGRQHPDIDLYNVFKN
jgi:hypothetical protein